MLVSTIISIAFRVATRWSRAPELQENDLTRLQALTASQPTPLVRGVCPDAAGVSSKTYQYLASPP
eukprot:7766130-Alexandrium_andersonii.AAC.1